MNGTYLFGRQKSSAGTFAAVAGLTVIAGAALLYAMPKARKACRHWLGEVVDGVKNRMDTNRNEERNWEDDLASAEKLKGPVKKRKDVSAIKVPGVGTAAWKDDWSND